jgi:hypothetical protein
MNHDASSALSRRATLAGAASLAAIPAAARTAAKRLPDGEIASFGAWRAWLTEPTRRYDHAVLGDDVEAGGLAVERGGRTFTVSLPEDAVFEDRRVRLVDMDGDGRPEALVVKAYQDRGAALSLWRIGDDSVTPLAEGPAIGRRHRWLNPVGVGRFAGTAEMMIAAVVTPHLAGSLRLYRLAGARLDEVARIDGYTNHIIGSRDLDLGRMADVDGAPAIILPTLDRRALAAVSFTGGAARALWTRPMPARITTLDAPRQGAIACRLEDGTARTVPLSGA